MQRHSGLRCAVFAKKGNESVALNKISDMVTNYVNQAYSYDEPAMEEPMDNEEELFPRFSRI